MINICKFLLFISIIAIASCGGGAGSSESSQNNVPVSGNSNTQTFFIGKPVPGDVDQPVVVQKNTPVPEPVVSDTLARSGVSLTPGDIYTTASSIELSISDLDGVEVYYYSKAVTNGNFSAFEVTLPEGFYTKRYRLYSTQGSTIAYGKNTEFEVNSTTEYVPLSQPVLVVDEHQNLYLYTDLSGLDFITHIEFIFSYETGEGEYKQIRDVTSDIEFGWAYFSGDISVDMDRPLVRICVYELGIVGNTDCRYPSDDFFIEALQNYGTFDFDSLESIELTSIAPKLNEVFIEGTTYIDFWNDIHFEFTFGDPYADYSISYCATQNEVETCHEELVTGGSYDKYLPLNLFPEDINEITIKVFNTSTGKFMNILSNSDSFNPYTGGISYTINDDSPPLLGELY